MKSPFSAIPFPAWRWIESAIWPEERGLYRQAYTDEVLIYLGRLKGLSDHDARRRAGEVLDQLGMTEHARKKVSELSRGMGQLIQFGATIIHQPDLVILDEPFSGLDPVNTLRLKIWCTSSKTWASP